jgi:hypothetical protein
LIVDRTPQFVDFLLGAMSAADTAATINVKNRSWQRAPLGTVVYNCGVGYMRGAAEGARIVRMLLDKGADPLQTADEDKPLLIMAVELGGRPDVVRELCSDSRVKIDATYTERLMKDETSALSVAVQMNHPDDVKLLLELGASRDTIITMARKPLTAYQLVRSVRVACGV